MKATNKDIDPWRTLDDMFNAPHERKLLHLNRFSYINRETDRFYDGDIFMVPDTEEVGIDNTTRSRDNIYEYRDVPLKQIPPQPLARGISQSQGLSYRPPSEASTGSALSLKDGLVSSSPNPNGRAPTPPVKPRAKARTLLVEGVPQTTV